jgi:very-short-patch-repair endonuclease
MSALLDPAVPRSDGKAYYRLRGMFAQKIVDFVAQRRTDGQIVAVIELDDRTQDAEKDAKRDEMLNSAGYRAIR